MPPVSYRAGSFPPQNIDWPRLVPLIGPANAELARFDGLLAGVANTDILLTPLTTQEAVLSSQIEGTEATMSEVLEYEAEGERTNKSPKKIADIKEIINYRKAIERALELLETLPLCQRIIKEAHRVLLAGVRGENKNPGEYRSVQNWVGKPGCGIDEATYVPAPVHKLPEAMSAWEKYMHAEEKDRLIQLALLHAEFEAIHPFLDGNGRLGRMLVPLFLHQRQVLSKPIFYISAYFERNRDEYYERLLTVSRDGDWTQWCVFFLGALASQARENLTKARSIMELHQRLAADVPVWTKSQYAPLALEYVFKNPIFTGSSFIRDSGIPTSTAKRILPALNKQGLLIILTPAKGRRPATYAFRELLGIAE